MSVTVSSTTNNELFSHLARIGGALMSIVIGLVIHTSRRAVFEEAARTLAGVKFEWIIYHHEHEIRQQVVDLVARRHVDGLLLGPVPFTACGDVLPEHLAVTVTRSAALDLSIAFGRALTLGWNATPVSIDTFDPGTVNEVSHALGLDRTQIACLPYSPEDSVDEIVDFHRKSLDERGGYIISVRTAVVERLDATAPVLGALPVHSTLRAELHELALRIRSQRASALQFAAGIFFVSRRVGQLSLDRARVGLMNLLVNTPEFADAWIENRGRRGVVVFAHKALFERVTHNWVSVPTLGEAERELAVRVRAGFGVGASARHCVVLAERAASRAEQADSPCGYMIEGDGVIIGPMGPSGPPLTFAYRGHGSDFEELARRAGLSPATLSRLAALENTLDGAAVSAGDLANSLGITDPSGRRLIRKLAECGLAITEGTAQTHGKGRPTHLYRLRIGGALASRAEQNPEAGDSDQEVPNPAWTGDI
jgi:DNA-binding MarR family transcriptional regulator